MLLMLLIKAQPSDCYTQLFNYREYFVFKSVSNELNISVDCNSSFTRSLRFLIYLEMDG